MTPEWLKDLLLWSGDAFLLLMAALCIMLLQKMWTNQINLATILNETNGDASMSRLQLLVFSLVIAVGLYLSILKNLALPEIPSSILKLLGISASTYAAGKGIAFSRPEGVTKPGHTNSPNPQNPPDMQNPPPAGP